MERLSKFECSGLDCQFDYHPGIVERGIKPKLLQESLAKWLSLKYLGSMDMLFLLELHQFLLQCGMV
ncbi:hypothetical protein AVEN_231550-1 [Araneus ventricosus]|uniref:Uncharacterized protein n=1 Tax=Araneus ventricosus TaxID=182803 RepID=A0A4Y2SIL7_ARAVE|nr:hypothetical protein AVEN_231550-1 [Araneus ventricosus]